MSLNLPDGWYIVPGDGLAGDPAARYSGWKYEYDRMGRYEHFAYVENGQVIHLNGSRDSEYVKRKLFGPKPFENHRLKPYIDSYLLNAEDKWGVRIIDLLCSPVDEWAEELKIEI